MEVMPRHRLTRYFAEIASRRDDEDATDPVYPAYPVGRDDENERPEPIDWFIGVVTAILVWAAAVCVLLTVMSFALAKRYSDDEPARPTQEKRPGKYGTP